MNILRFISPPVILALIGLGLIPLMVFAVGQGGQFWPDAYAWRVTRFTIVQAALSTLLSVVPAIFVARALARQNFAGKRVLLALFAVPQALPVIVALFGLTALYGAAGTIPGWINLYSLSGILLAHVFFNLPLAVRLLLEALEASNAESHRLAAQLGFGDGAVFRHVDWPILKSALPQVAALIFLLCAASFVTVLVFGGPAATTLEVAIYQSLRMDFDVSRALTLSFIQIVLSGVLVFAAAKALSAPATSPALRLGLRRFDGQTTVARIVDFMLAALAALLVVPVLAALLAQGIANISWEPALWQALRTSLIIALLSSCIAIPLGWNLAGLQSRHAAWNGMLTATGLAGFIFPPAVIATGWFLLVRGLEGGIALSIALIAAMNVLMSLPYVLTVLVPAMRKTSAQHDRLCAQLGVNGIDRLWNVDLPSMRGPLSQALLMAFVMSLGDLTAVTLLGSQGLVTLPSLVQQQMGHYQSAAAGGTALVLAALCLVLTFAAQRMSRWT